ncbi:MAG: heme-binding protein [Gammaproteobacteria bacterium]|nr:heme-binding protein [Gammaproteobacteria bacterium]
MNQIQELSHTDAARIVDAIRERLEVKSAGAAVAVVDRHGELMAFLRTDGCNLSSITIAMNKAFTAAREQTETEALGERSREEGFPMTNFGDPRYVSWGGGVPVVVGGLVVGAVGVSGLPEGEDVALAQMGAALA